MKKMRKLLCLLMVLGLLLSGCKGKNQETQASETKPTETAPGETDVPALTPEAQAYLDGIAALEAGDYALEVEYEKTIQLAGQTYLESGTVELEYWDRNTEDFLGRITQKITYGDGQYEIRCEDVYLDGYFYQELNRNPFYGKITAEEFLSYQLPTQLLDPTLYTLTQEGKQITFTEPTAAESWVAGESIVIHSGSGSAQLDDSGKLSASSYAIRYGYGGVLVDVSYEMTVVEIAGRPKVDDDTDDAGKMDNPFTAFALEHAKGCLSQTQQVQVSDNSVIYMEAAAVMGQLNVDLATYAAEDQFAMRWKQGISFHDYSTKADEEYDVVEEFKNGTYAVTVNGERDEDTSVPEKKVKASVAEYLDESIPASDMLAKGEMTPFPGVIYLEYDVTEEWGLAQNQHICYELYQNPDLLDDAASDYECVDLEFYLGLDVNTLLPTACGLTYEGEHILDGEKYTITNQQDLSLNLAALDTYKEIYEESLPEQEPEKKATPLLYKVTGADGQLMWLMGTIHVGDERTAYLPQELYDAFDSCDALAIECDVEGFEEKLEQDEALMERVSDYYFYNLLTARSYIETPDLYQDAVKMMKATGNYYYNTEYYKVGMWGGDLDRFFMQQSAAFSSGKGVERRLTERAEKNGMQLLEVESVEAQIKMESDFSAHLQEAMLYSSMQWDAPFYWESLMELYELWCAGDEAGIAKALQDDTWTLKEEDFDLETLTGEDLERAKEILADMDNINAQLKVLQEEYEKAMERDRNKGMLDVAISYLEGDQTVFYAVGTAHVVAADGLVNTLREAGYTVELVSYQ